MMAKLRTLMSSSHAAALYALVRAGMALMDAVKRFFTIRSEWMKRLILPVSLCSGTGVDVVLWTPRLYDMGDGNE